MTQRTVIEIGQGSPALVLIHGLCCHASDWKRQIDDFSGSSHVIAPTLRGHDDDLTVPGDLTIAGLAQDIVALLAARGIKEAILVGHSLGTRVAIEAHAMAPERVQGLVLLDGSNTVEGDLDGALSAFDGIADKHLWAQELFRQMFLPGTHLDVQDMYRDRIENMPAARIEALYRNMIKWDGTRLATRVAQIETKPVFLLQSTIRGEDGARRWLRAGETGPYVDLLAKALTNLQVVTYPGIGHFPMLDAPERMHKDIEAWLTNADLR